MKETMTNRMDTEGFIRRDKKKNGGGDTEQRPMKRGRHRLVKQRANPEGNRSDETEVEGSVDL
jgi:hypothetical protein